ncbi:hypothetical protein KIPB_009046 [Kipferlia bialata]|uniref:RING-type domain-containing protein n=1 Tax=Kipferlia bialata TaxID=797122 RepID=A0A9K3D1N8_9EUKA|nr:hypothetical protein KIPB_009046 [Kipferlia bialata]|eukprot:g9046.t1
MGLARLLFMAATLHQSMFSPVPHVLTASEEYSEDETAMQCAICLSGMSADLSTTPCGHIFHTDCLGASLRTTHVCPICRTAVAEGDIHSVFLPVQDPSVSRLVRDMANPTASHVRTGGTVGATRVGYVVESPESESDRLYVCLSGGFSFGTRVTLVHEREECFGTVVGTDHESGVTIVDLDGAEIIEVPASCLTRET